MAEKTNLIGKIKKKDDVEIYGSIAEFKNEFYVDFREYVQTEKYSGPTKKGIRFHIENWDAFRELVEKMDQEIRKLS